MATVTESRAAGQFDQTLLWCLNGLLFFWLITTSGAIAPVLAIGGEGIEMTQATRSKLRLLLLPSLALAPLLVVARFRAILQLLLRNGVLVLLLLWIVASIAWSTAPEITFRRSVSLIINTSIACYLVVERDIERILKLLAWCFLFLLAVSAAFVILLPDVSKMPDGRGLRGAFVHKNLMGETAALSLIVLVAALRASVIPRWIGIAGIGLGLALLVPAGAASSIVAGAAVIVVQIILFTGALPVKQRAVILALGTALGIIGVGIIVANVDALLGVLGRDATLTGRTQLWQFVLQAIAERPWHGYGYTSFFEVSRVAQYLIDAYRWAIPSAHNGYLEVLLGIGVIGLLLLVAFFGVMIYRLAVGWERYSPAAIMLVVPMTTFLLVLNVTESSLLASSGLSWIVLIIACLALTPGFRQPHSRAIGDQPRPLKKSKSQPASAAST